MARKKREAHPYLVTVAFRGTLADKLRRMAKEHGLSLAKLIQDAVLLYEQQIAAGYEPGSLFSAWKAEQDKEQ